MLADNTKTVKTLYDDKIECRIVEYNNSTILKNPHKGTCI